MEINQHGNIFFSPLFLICPSQHHFLLNTFIISSLQLRLHSASLSPATLLIIALANPPPSEQDIVEEPFSPSAPLEKHRGWRIARDDSLILGSVYFSSFLLRTVNVASPRGPWATVCNLLLILIVVQVVLRGRLVKKSSRLFVWDLVCFACSLPGSEREFSELLVELPSEVFFPLWLVRLLSAANSRGQSKRVKWQETDLTYTQMKK